MAQTAQQTAQSKARKKRTPVVVKESNRDRIDAWIGEAEGRSEVRRIDYGNVADACAHIEWSLGIPKKDMEGVEFIVDRFAQVFPHAYRGIPQSTHFRVRFSSGTWKLLEVWRGDTLGVGSAFVCRSLPDAAVQAIVRSKQRFAYVNPVFRH